MRIACTNCAAVYELPPERVRPGRSVKCARCGTVWLPAGAAEPPPEIVAAPEPPPEPEPEPPIVETVPERGPEPPPEPEPHPVRPPSRLPVLLGWAVTVLLLVALGWAAVTYRGAVMAAWPPSERAYRALHLA